MLTNKDLRKMFDELDEQTGAYTSHIEVKFNGRLKTTLGRYRYFNCDCTPFSFEFSSVLKNLPYDEVKQVVIHEYAHFLRNSYWHKGNYGHDSEFKKIVRSLGGTETEPNISGMMQEQINEVRKNEKKYEVYCKECGKKLRAYKTKSGASNCVKNYNCGCCHGELYFKEIEE